MFLTRAVLSFTIYRVRCHVDQVQVMLSFSFPFLCMDIAGSTIQFVDYYVPINHTLGLGFHMSLDRRNQTTSNTQDL
jgi:hypothetical protein